jgi:hypothetical protein
MKPYDWIGDLLSAYGSKPLILVEGEEDVALYARMLDLIEPDWRRRFAIEHVDGKERVFQGCRKVPSWRGLVDRDEWTEARIAKEQQEAPAVRVLPRFTAQNYWIDPEELWALIPTAAKASFGETQTRLRAEIEDKRPAWTAHGAMWRVMLQRRAGLSHLGFPQELINSPVTDEAQIMEILTRWHDHLGPEAILTEYRAERDAALARPAHEQYAQAIHGKRFFRQVVTVALNIVFRSPGKTAQAWSADLIASTASVPSDLKPILAALLI